MVRMQDPADEKIGSEIMHILLYTQPPTNIIGVYLETLITNDEADEAHRVLNEKVRKRVRTGLHLYSDMNVAINPNCGTYSQAAKHIQSGKSAS